MNNTINQNNFFPLLKIPNLIPTLVDIFSEPKLIVTPIFINFPHHAFYLLILYNLKTNEIIYASAQRTIWNSKQFINFVEYCISNNLLTHSDVVFHILKQNPLTSKVVAFFILSHNYRMSYYTRNTTLPNISATRELFRTLLTAKYIENLDEFITRWNRDISPVVTKKIQESIKE